MNVRLSTGIVSRSTFIPRENKRYNNSDRRNNNVEGRRHENQRQNYLQNRDQRKVPFNSPKVAMMNVNEYSNAHDEDYEDQNYNDNGEQLEDESYDEQFDEPDINNVQAGITNARFVKQKATMKLGSAHLWTMSTELNYYNVASSKQE